LARVEQLKVDFEEGRISASYLVGKGLKNPKKIAQRWLETRREELTQALETHGRSFPVLVANAEYTKRLHDKGASSLATSENG
jgi:hypothetical protein